MILKQIKNLCSIPTDKDNVVNDSQTSIFSPVETLIQIKFDKAKPYEEGGEYQRILKTTQINTKIKRRNGK